MKFYKHGSIRNQFHLSGQEKYRAQVDFFEPAAYELDKDEIDPETPECRYVAAMPFGSTSGHFETREEAIAHCVSALKYQGWTESLETAQRRAEKEVELRKSGKLRYSGPKRCTPEELEKCHKEIMAIE